MAYIGGKSKGARYIVALLNNPALNGVDYVEPFVGYAHILSQVHNKKSYRAFDVNKNVIALHKFISSGRTDFPHITKEEYVALRDNKYVLPDNSPYTLEVLKAFAAFAYTYSGKEWGGYTLTDASGKRNYAIERFNFYKKLQEREPYMQASFEESSFEAVDVKKNSLIYADPPYAPFHSNVEYYGTMFDHDKFWDTVRKWVLENDCVVLVSEYNAPKDFFAIRTWGTISTVNQATTQRVRMEHVFVHKSQFNTLFLLNYKQELTLPYVLYEKLSERPFNQMLEILDIGRNIDHARAFIDVIVRRTVFRTVVFNALDDENNFRSNPMFPFKKLKESEVVPNDPFVAIRIFQDDYPEMHRHVALIAWTLATGVFDKELYEVAFELVKPVNRAKAIRLERCFTATVQVENAVLIPLMEMGALRYLQDETNLSQALFLQGRCGEDESPGYLPLPIGIISSTYTYNPLFYERNSWNKIQASLKAKQGWTDFLTDREIVYTADEMLNLQLQDTQPFLNPTNQIWTKYRSGNLKGFVLDFGASGIFDEFPDHVTVEVEAFRLLQEGFAELSGNLTGAEKQKLLDSRDDYEMEFLSIPIADIEALEVKDEGGPPPPPRKRTRKSKKDF